ncbi:MAG: carbon-nitrogen hydrolase family protein [Candidatus Omnitrophica bacterium]|nr:carbon-nitrogen hydrolase family protein [Candidatus Omnitrophota bacterium]
MEKKIKIGMGQLLVEGGEPDRNLERAQKMIREAAALQCDLILLPETLDLAWTHPSAKTEAEPIPGKYSDLLANQARENKIYVCAGLTERDGDKVYNSAVLIDADGNILLKYRKINVLEVGQEFYQIGDRLGVVETPFGIIGVNICADNYIDGICIGHTLARMGAQIILSPSSWTVDYSITEEDDPYGEKWMKPYTTLAKFYNLVIVGTTSVGYIVGGPYEGKKMIGCSLAVRKEGVLAKGDYNEFAGKLIPVEFSVPARKEKGTSIGKMLEKQNFEFIP